MAKNKIYKKLTIKFRLHMFMVGPNQNFGNKLMDWAMNENDRKLIEFIPIDNCCCSSELAICIFYVLSNVNWEMWKIHWRFERIYRQFHLFIIECYGTDIAERPLIENVNMPILALISESIANLANMNMCDHRTSNIMIT